MKIQNCRTFIKKILKKFKNLIRTSQLLKIYIVDIQNHINNIGVKDVIIVEIIDYFRIYFSNADIISETCIVYARVCEIPGSFMHVFII